MSPAATSEELDLLVPTHRLDMHGEPCPYPAVATLEALPKLAPGDVLEVISDCAQSVNTIPHDARNHGYEYLGMKQDGPTLRYYIRVPPNPAR